MKKTIRVLLVVTLALSMAEAFTTKKKESRTSFQHPSFPKESARDPHAQDVHSAKSGNTMFAVPKGATPAQLVQCYEPEEEVEVSYSIALVSCMLSLALGFGLGYGT